MGSALSSALTRKGRIVLKNFQKNDVAEALDLLLHMIEVLAERARPDSDDIARVRELISEIKNAR